MIKRVILILTTFFQLVITNDVNGISPTPKPVINETEMTFNGDSALLMDYQSGTVIIAKQIEKKLAPASMTKMMGMYLVMQGLKQGTIKEDQIVTVSDKAASMGGSQIYLEVGEKMSVEDLFKSVCIASANDAMYALGETISGSNQLFIKLMNETAKKLGMNNTNFVNVAGYDDPDHYTTAYDMAVLARQLVLQYGERILSYTSLLEGYVREDKPFWLVNTNKLVASYPGMDGLKTGFTNQSLYCLTATAMRDNLRFIAVSMHNKTIKERTEDITTLLDYGFATYKSLKVYQKNEIVASTKFDKAKEQETYLTFNEDVYLTVKKSETVENLKETYIFTRKIAPIKAYSKVGTLTIENEDGWQFKYDFVVMNDVHLLKWYHDFFSRLKAIFF